MVHRDRGPLETESGPINWRRTADGVTIFDESNPDAWIRVSFEAGTPPEHRLFMICEGCGAISPHPVVPGNGAVCGECGARFVSEE